MFNGRLVAVRSASRNNFLYASDSGATEQSRRISSLRLGHVDKWVGLAGGILITCELSRYQQVLLNL